VAQKPTENTPKLDQLNAQKTRNTGASLTHDSGAPVVDTEQSLRAGRRGPALLNDPDFIANSHISIGNAFPKRSCMPAVSESTVNSNSTSH
jgi:hypothetical protein